MKPKPGVQFVTLLEKCWLLRKVHYIRATAESVVVIILVGILAVIFSQRKLYFNNKNAKPTKPIDDLSLVNMNILVGYENLTNEISRILNNAQANCGITLLYTVHNRQQLRNVVANYVNGKNNLSDIIAGIYLSHKDDEIEIDITATDFMVDHRHHNYIDASKISPEKYELGYWQSSYSNVEICFGRAFLNSTDYEIQFKQFPSLTNDNRDWSRFLASAIIFGWAINCGFMFE